MNKYFLILFIILSNITIYSQISDFKGVDFKNADKIAYSLKGENLKNLPNLSYNLTSNLPNDLEKFRAIYTWVCTNIEGDYSATVINKGKREKLQNDSLKLNNWNNSFKSTVFKKLLKKQQTVCTGYAYLIKTLSELANIECEIIDGYGRTTTNKTNQNKVPNHSWNAVKINNKWYLCDATWSSGSFDLEEAKFKYNYDDGYFLANPELFSKDHYPIDFNWLLTSQTYNLNTFWDQPFIYGSTYKFEILPIEPSKMYVEAEKNKEIHFLLKASKPIILNKLTIELISGSNSQTVKPTIIPLQENLFELKYIFKNQGLYDVHFKIDNNVVLTYVVKVKKEKK